MSSRSKNQSVMVSVDLNHPRQPGSEASEAGHQAVRTVVETGQAETMIQFRKASKSQA